MRSLPRARCLDLLRTVQIGRVAFEAADGLALIPVNFAMSGEDVVLRTSAESRLGVRLGARVLFEADDLEPALRSGWSVVVRGIALAVTDEQELGELRRVLQPWARGEREQILRIRGEDVTGREIIPSPPTRAA
jgi:nitroimidazol reductase NimA-like FMN-containing flavoprotein (pyridoxamine 5'-phosphate oxidase superfamily)